jgi:hypothetical protein
MLAFHDRVSIEDALSSSLDCRLRVLIGACIKQDIRPTTYDLIDYTTIVVARPGDTERTIRRELGFSPLVNVFDGARFGTPEYMPFWDVLHDHDGWFELIFTVGNDGFAFVLFVQDAAGVEPDLLTLCRTHARTTIHLI